MCHILKHCNTHLFDHLWGSNECVVYMTCTACFSRLGNAVYKLVNMCSTSVWSLYWCIKWAKTKGKKKGWKKLSLNCEKVHVPLCFKIQCFVHSQNSSHDAFSQRWMKGIKYIHEHGQAFLYMMLLNTISMVYGVGCSEDVTILSGWYPMFFCQRFFHWMAGYIKRNFRYSGCWNA